MTTSARAAMPPQIAFLFDLIQDISVLRPIVRVMAAERRCALLLLCSHKLKRRDRSGVWFAELVELASATGARVAVFDSPLSAIQHLQGQRGLIFSASETDLPAHETNHEVFRAAPSGYVRVTVQHGFECVGFRQNREQTIAHGEAIRFAADVVCGWGPITGMTHLAVSERAKYFELGPTMVLDRLYDRSRPHSGEAMGLVCENLHSVRMRTTGDFQAIYLQTIQEFAAAEARDGRRLALRPHPGGQFVVKTGVALPDNVELANSAMYKTDLRRFAYGISAPSSVLIDLVMAGLPTAVWTDGDHVIDTSGYAGLFHVSTVADWIDFARTAVSDPEAILVGQRDFLRNNGIDASAETIRDRLLDLVDGLLLPVTAGRPLDRPKRLLLVANGNNPTLQISFVKPLEELTGAGMVDLTLLTEGEILAAARADPADPEGLQFACAQIDRAKPDLAVFCRYSGPVGPAMLAHLRAHRVPVIFHIDDDLLNVPPEIGAKHVEHNRIERTSTVRHLLDHADLVYASTPRLKDRLADLGFLDRVLAGAIYCTSGVHRPAAPVAATTIGFMGNDKAPELDDLVPVIAGLLERNPQVRFELFGSMAMPAELQRFGLQVRAYPRVNDYDAFVTSFRALDWHIGLAPLRSTPFNVVKADTKWVDYTSIGVAVVASAGTAYDACCADGCGILASGPHEWSEALQRLVDDPDERYRMAAKAQDKLRNDYTMARLTDQVLAMFAEASARMSDCTQGSSPD
ncbi:glycosyltransferase [Novosphingobium piscinae]|uniref:Glycosyltransferase n=1 Tax=Novosphingobium piscinae TaxID=1507448 RepID=A0A7X1KPU2_9SPHN|nr:glycosyltransferase [Novosphingobium piscinae]MBC2669074.1 glycosyltransferase [Novosphingobium piscinae]